MLTPHFGRLATAMVTPFDEEGNLAPDAAVELGRHLAESGSDAIVAAGTTGESPVLSDEELIELWRTLAESLTIPVIAGSGSNDTAHSVRLTKEATSAGVAGILAVTPYYSRPSQLGLVRHFTAMAEATDLPVLLYDIPARTGRKIANETMLALCRDTTNVIGVKDAAADLASTARLLAAAPPGFEVYSGDDSLNLPFLALGAVGAVSVAAHWVGPELSEVISLFFSGEVEAAALLNRELVRYVSFQSGDDAPNPLPAKAVMRALGLKVGECRLPHGRAPEWLDQAAAELLSDLATFRQARPTNRLSA